MSENSTKILCFNCEKELEFSPGAKILRSEECPHCYASIRSCKMCKFYDQKSYNECKEPMAERIVEKEKANYCDYYDLGGSHDPSTEKNKLLSAADALFKK